MTRLEVLNLQELVQLKDSLIDAYHAIVASCMRAKGPHKDQLINCRNTVDSIHNDVQSQIDNFHKES